MARGKKKTEAVKQNGIEDQQKPTTSVTNHTPQATEYEESSEKSITMEQLKEIIQQEAQLYRELNSDSQKALQILQDDFKEFKENHQRLVENLRHEEATKDE